MNIFLEIKVSVCYKEKGMVAIFSKQHTSSTFNQFMTHVDSVVL